MHRLAHASGPALVAPVRKSKQCNALKPWAIKRLQVILTDEQSDTNHPMKRRMMELNAPKADRDAPSPHSTENDA